MTYHIISLFPETIRAYAGESILGRAQGEKIIKIKYYDIRDFSKDKHKKVDDRPYAGGPGMVMVLEPILRAWEKVIKEIKKVEAKTGNKAKVETFIFAPRGQMFNTSIATKLAKTKTDIILICGRYEGIDGRVKKITKAKELSIGDYVLTGGEIPAMAVIDCVSRQIEGVLGKFDSREEARVSSGEVYTRPEVYEFNGKKYRVPKVLLSGNHKQIEEWKKRC